MTSHDDSYDWSAFLGDHPLFGELSGKDIEILLDPGNSAPRSYNRDEVIFRSGEIGNSFFLIGEGSVNVELSSEESSSTIISTLYKGDYFGEMSAIDSQGGRAATIAAREDCRLLEIRGKPFQKVLKSNPELEFQLLTMLTARLRHVNDHLLNNTRLTYDSKFSLLSEKIESQSKVVDASLNASKAVFEQTKIRTSEIIQAAERGRTRITWVISTLTGGFTLLLAVFSFLGYERLNTAQQMLTDIEGVKTSVEETQKGIDNALLWVEARKLEIENSKSIVDDAVDRVDAIGLQISALNQAISNSNKAGMILFRNLIPVFMLQVEKVIEAESQTDPGPYQSDPAELGRQILEANNDQVTIDLFKRIFFTIEDSHRYSLENVASLESGLSDQRQRAELVEENRLNRARISFYTEFMYLYIHDLQEKRADNAMARFLCNYILLLTYALDENYARDNDGYSSINSAMFPRDSFDSRLKSLQVEFQGMEVKRIKQLDSDFVSDLKQVELAESGLSGASKEQLENLLN
jgi:CRP-like cAMP-binding protein